MIMVGYFVIVLFVSPENVLFMLPIQMLHHVRCQKFEDVGLLG